MRYARFIGISAAAWIVATAALTAGQSALTIEMKDSKGQAVGTASLTGRSGGGVEIALDLNGLPPGVHAIHFHETAQCDAPDFESAGAHFNPAMRKHGLQNPEGPHAGDMDNFTVSSNGTARTTLLSEKAALGGGANSLLSNGGTALVIHAAPDDMKTDPAGNSGDRIACGVVK